jgi:hypothetical protein
LYVINSRLYSCQCFSPTQQAQCYINRR